jgi:hypothetical protein
MKVSLIVPMHVEAYNARGLCFSHEYVPNKKYKRQFVCSCLNPKNTKPVNAEIDCKDCGDLEEYMECKIERTANSLKFTQPVPIQSYSNKFGLPTRIYKTPMQARSVLVAGVRVEALSPAKQEKYCTGTGKAMHTMQYSKSETYNAVQNLSQHMHEATKDHYKAMLCVLKYSVNIANQGLVLKPNRKWDGSQTHELILSGCLDLDYAKEPKVMRSISGHMVYLKEAPAMFKS